MVIAMIRILIVEKETERARRLSAAMRELGYEPLTVSDGAEALALLDESSSLRQRSGAFSRHFEAGNNPGAYE